MGIDENIVIEIKAKLIAIEKELEDHRVCDQEQNKQLAQINEKEQKLVADLNEKLQQLQSHLKALVKGHNNKNENISNIYKMMNDLELAQESLLMDYIEINNAVRHYKEEIEDLRHHFKTYKAEISEILKNVISCVNSHRSRYKRFVTLVITTCVAIFGVIIFKRILNR
jgi:chromosome segregation ATPase